MMKFALIALLASLACKLVFGKWPWQFAQGKSTRAQALFKARKLLGVRENATRQEVLQAHKQLIAMVHPDKGGTNDQVHEANAARDLLINELPYPSPDKP
ncbi:molecular chaperone DnaJ [Pontixanthobacter sp. CEM42]|uniref:molecular chaperone DnaJ n=1 Tax=Pontixanthobacter sp. CEM42 TaxID=2792077 RepID=UPI001ADFF7AC|nr:molecular chaperone DnaJ [Pontixanthobacter sp. CEM42]